MKTIKAYIGCPEKPELLAGQPIGQYHCPVCGCMVVAAMKHPPCFKGMCILVDNGTHPGEIVEIDINQECIQHMGIESV